MPDAHGNIKGIALGGRAGASWERIFGQNKRELIHEMRHTVTCVACREGRCPVGTVGVTSRQPRA